MMSMNKRWYKIFHDKKLPLLDISFGSLSNTIIFFIVNTKQTVRLVKKLRNHSRTIIPLQQVSVKKHQNRIL